MALRGIKVIELAGLAPGPLCGLILSNFGASVIRIDKVSPSPNFDVLANGKQSLAINLKTKEGVEIFRKLCRKSDVLIDTYRPGVMESLELGPNILLKDNPKLIFSRLTGYGQYGKYSKRAGHDINYVALTGILSMLRKKNEKPFPPLNLLADFGGGGLMCVLGILMALLERNISGKGQVIDCSMVEGLAYMGSWLYRSHSLPIWENDPGNNMLDGGAHYYQVYETKDGKFMAVGAIEPKFYSELLQGLKLSEEEYPQFGDPNKLKEIFKTRFLEKTQSEWCQIFENTDACVTPVLNLTEVATNPHNKDRNSFTWCSNQEYFIPSPSPRLSRTPGVSQAMKPQLIVGQHTSTILKNLDYSDKDMDALENNGIIKRVADFQSKY